MFRQLNLKKFEINEQINTFIHSKKNGKKKNIFFLKSKKKFLVKNKFVLAKIVAFFHRSKIFIDNNFILLKK